MLYAQYVKERIWKTVPRDKVGGHWRVNDKGYLHICKELSDNFIEKMPSMANIKGSVFAVPIKYHKDARSLNSSQVMCINFFQKFFERQEYEDVLLAALRKCGLPIPQGVLVSNAIFEYEPNMQEGTNFDFYMMLSNGCNISMEIKYTEAEFGGTSEYSDGDPIKYGKKWEGVYSSIVKRCPYLQANTECDSDYKCLQYGRILPDKCKHGHKCDILKFFEHYQINRNIALAADVDLVVFLTPQANETLSSGRLYIDSLQNPNIRNIYWEDIVDAVLETTEMCEELNRYYRVFKNKYIDFVPWQLTK